MINRYASLRQGLVGCWVPSLGASGYRLIDRSGNNNHGVLTNMDPGTDWVPSGGKLALDFDGVNNHTTILMNPIFNMPNVKTISAWIYSKSYDGVSQTNDIITTDNINTTNRTWQFSALDENNTNIDAKLNLFSFGTGGGTQSITTSTEVLQVGIWHHIAATTVDGLITPTQVFLYVDGIPQSTTVTSSGSYIGPNQLTANNPLNFGRRPGTGGQDLHFNGSMDDIRIYNRVLTPSEIRLLYTGGRGVGLAPERIKHRRKTSAAAFNRRRRIIIGAS